MVNYYPSMNGGASNRQETYLGPAAVTDSGSLNFQAAIATIEAISHRHCHLIQMRDGYGYRLVSHFQY